MRREGPIARVLAAVVLTLTLLLGASAPTALTEATFQGVSAEQLQIIEERTVGLRGLPQLAPIEKGFIQRADVRPHIEASLYRNNSPEEIEASQLRLEVFGYIEPGLDIIQVYLDVIGEQVLGFYDTDEARLNIVADSPRFGPNDEITLAHEIGHALQDQHYGLRDIQERLRGENDLQLAFQALIEGDARLIEFAYAGTHFTPAQWRELEESASSVSMAAFDAAPLIIQRELLFPYTDGLSFVGEHFIRGSWTAVDNLFGEPPVSTEQILHPEKYLAREGPVPLPLPDLAGLLGPDWRFLEESTLGELDIRILVEQFVDLPTAERAAAGWGGDRFQLFRRDADGALLMGMRTAWDTEPDAVEFYNAYQRVAGRRHGPDLAELPPPVPTPPAGASWGARAGRWLHALVRDGSQVTLVISNDPGAISTTLQALRAPALTAP